MSPRTSATTGTTRARLTEYGDREPTEPWTWAGPARSVTGRTWGGCIEVVQWILTAGRFPTDPSAARGRSAAAGVIGGAHPGSGVRLDRQVARRARHAGGRGRRRRRAAADVGLRDSAIGEERRAQRAEQRDMVLEVVHAYNPEAVVVVGPPFGHTRPQWILPYGGLMTVDGASQAALRGLRLTPTEVVSATPGW